jgi:hypothetical protein
MTAPMTPSFPTNPLPVSTPAAPTPDALRTLTERYARYSRSAGGLSLVVGGALTIITFAIGAFVDLSQWMRWTLALAPMAWLATKELLRAFYYQRAGAVSQQVSPTLQRQRRWMAVYLCAVSALIIGGVLVTAGRAALVWPMTGYLALVAALPFAAMRWFWSSNDFLVGVLLFCQAAVVTAGINYGPWWLVYAGGCGLWAILAGLREHRDFLAIQEELTGRAPR